jgi:hypothetical protein
VTAISTDRDLDISASMHVTHGDTAADHACARSLGEPAGDHGSGGAGAYEEPPRQGSSQNQALY